MGAKVRIAAKTALGEFVTVLSPGQGYERWSASYDSDPNPLLALESRLLTPRFGNLAGLHRSGCRHGHGPLDGARGFARRERTSASMSPARCSRVAARKAVVVYGRLILGDVRSLPFRSDSVDLAICSFALSYLPFAGAAFGEMARVARRVIVSDLHSAAMLRGWTRSFQSDGGTCKIEHFYHSMTELDQTARAA